MLAIHAGLGAGTAGGSVGTLPGAPPRERQRAVVLDSAERIPVQVIGSANIIPTPHALRSEQWTPLDDYFSIRDTDLTPEQAKRACYFVQPLTEMGIKAPASNT